MTDFLGNFVGIITGFISLIQAYVTYFRAKNEGKDVTPPNISDYINLGGDTEAEA